VIDAVVGGYNNELIIQFYDEHFSDCHPTSDRNGRYVVRVSETIF